MITDLMDGTGVSECVTRQHPTPWTLRSTYPANVYPGRVSLSGPRCARKSCAPRRSTVAFEHLEAPDEPGAAHGHALPRLC